MPSRFDQPLDPKLPSPEESRVDTSKRYDVYRSERNVQMIVYRNARFSGMRALFSTGHYDVLSQFVELELAGGQTVFLSRHSVVKFCEHGVEVPTEVVPTK
jgi:hypothetical protein